MKMQHFFDNEFKLFSIADCVRSIPSVIDGFKPSGRKCIFGLIKHGENAGEIKVASLAGWVSNISAYHHGENSLCGTIVGLAQNYTGSNNLNYFMPIGQFGNRLSPEGAAPRYIFTEFTDDFRKIFKHDDDIILEYLNEDGQSIEPKYYIPILPNILINGAKGMGTGYSTNILNYNPKDLVSNILSILNDEEPAEILPHYRNFKGNIRKVGRQVIMTGVYEITNSTTITITELPIGIYNDDYKEHLNNLQDTGVIKSYINNPDGNNLNFIVTVPRSTAQLSHEAILTKFKLVAKDTENFVAWTEHNEIKVFVDAQQVIDHFVEFRLTKYEERRQALLAKFKADLAWNEMKIIFIQFYITNAQLFANAGKKELNALLAQNKFDSKLLEIKIYNLTKDAIDKLMDEIIKIEKEVSKLEKTNAIKMYINELKSLEL
jgi:DNA topoisomerase-2